MVVTGILITAIVTDVRKGRISNRLMIAGLLAGIILQTAAQGAAGVGTWLSGVSIPVILCSILFFMRALGAGDVKLFSVIGGLSDLKTIWYCMLFAFVAGAVLACLKMVRKRIFWSRIFCFRDYIQRVFIFGKLLPYDELTGEERQQADHVMHFSVAIGIGYGICRGYLRWVK